MRAADRARNRLVDALRASGRVRSPSVEEAFRAVPRHLFLPDLPLREAYADEAVAVQYVDGVATSSASQPSMMAIMLEQLGLQPGHRVLEVGAGTGYNAALMAHLVGPAGAVTAVDIDAELVERAAGHLAAAGVSGVDLHCGDGALGHPPAAPYDRIVLTVGSADVRPEWVAQLAPGGRLLLPLSVRGSQLSVALDLGPDGVLRSDSVRSCAFIRLRGLGAGPEPTVPLGVAGLSMQAADDSSADPGAVAAALAEPGPVHPAGVRLGPGDLWDGFGLWVALGEPAACRLLAPEPGSAGDVATGAAALARGWLPVGPGLATLALTGPAGLATIVFAPARAGGGRGPRAVAIQAFGAGGPGLAQRLDGLLERWAALGRPSASALQLTAVPRSATAANVDVAAVEKEHCRLLVGWTSGPGRTVSAREGQD